jgi:TfoX/Sxy family transcriptional regulator of competence genes
MRGDPTPADRFEELLGEFSDTDGVTLPHGGSGFGRSALRYQGKIFAMFVRGDLVVKLSEQRVDELVEAGHGERFTANKGTPMREWFAAAPDCPLPWSQLATDALTFARASAAPARAAPGGRPRRTG